MSVPLHKCSENKLDAYVKDVDKELRDAELLYRVRDAIDWDLPTLYQEEVKIKIII